MDISSPSQSKIICILCLIASTRQARGEGGGRGGGGGGAVRKIDRDGMGVGNRQRTGQERVTTDYGIITSQAKPDAV